MRFQRLDLNLLVALDALLSERSVSLAADRLCLSQSATSSALGRLREYFGDDLLVMKGRAMILTARAEALIDPVRAVLEQVRTTIAIAPAFDPATADRQIRIMASDYSTQVLLTEALAMFEAEAPHLRFEIQPMGDNPVEAVERGLVDLLLTIDYAISSDHPSQILFEDDYVVVGDAKNPALAGEITREAYFAAGHVTARFGKSRVPAFEDWFVRRQKQQRRVEVVAPSFLSLPGLVMREVPFDIPPIRETIQWHISNNNDRGLRWVVERLSAFAADSAVAADNVVPLMPMAEARRDELAVQFQASPGVSERG